MSKFRRGRPPRAPSLGNWRFERNTLPGYQTRYPDGENNSRFIQLGNIDLTLCNCAQVDQSKSERRPENREFPFIFPISPEFAARRPVRRDCVVSQAFRQRGDFAITGGKAFCAFTALIVAGALAAWEQEAIDDWTKGSLQRPMRLAGLLIPTIRALGLLLKFVISLLDPIKMPSR